MAKSGMGLTDRAKGKIAIVRNFISIFSIDEPVQSKRLEVSYGLSGPEIRAIVHFLRSEGVPIGSDHRGYFFARSKYEIETTLEHLYQRENSIREARLGLESAFEVDNQLSLI